MGVDPLSLNQKVQDPRVWQILEEWRERLNHELHPTHTVADSITLNDGTSASTLSDIQTLLDGNIYDLAEVAATPGFDLEVNFVNVSRVYGLHTRMYYDGNHYTEVQLYDYVNAQWDTMITVESSNGMNLRYVEIPENPNYVNSDNEAKVRIYHPSNGNAADDAYIDYIGIVS